MKFLFIIVLVLGFQIAYTQQPSDTANKISPDAVRQSVDLQLSTSVTEERYSMERSTPLLRLTLNLTYSNIGHELILLDKKSSLIYRKLLSSSLKAAFKEKYQYDEVSSFIDVRSMQSAGMRLQDFPDRAAFIAVKPGESYTVSEPIILRLSDGTRDTADYLRPGSYYLQLRVATWYYIANPEIYREKWRDDGYLWSQDITSQPMPLTIKKGP